MTPTKLLIGQIIVVFAIMIAGVWAATQWTAAMLAYQPQLGSAWFILFDTPVYRLLNLRPRIGSICLAPIKSGAGWWG